MINVSKLSSINEPLIPPSRKVNANKAFNNSLSGTNVRSLTQPKATIDLKKRKKLNPTLSQPKSLKIVKKSKLKDTITVFHHAEDSKATIDATTGLGSSKSIEEVVNHLKPLLSKKQLTSAETIITSLGSISLDEVLEETLSDPKSMLDDEILFVSEGDDNSNEAMVEMKLRMRGGPMVDGSRSPL
ncbi:hypothetical protein Tco_0931508 [Tanacetum coccineum]